MVMAVLEKRMGMRLGENDVFLNVAGGVRVAEPAADLAVAIAIASSYRDAIVDPETVAIGEIGLGGEVRSVAHADRRMREAQRLGFHTAIVPSSKRNGGDGSMRVVRVRAIHEAVEMALGPRKEKA
jgi:DNA repair protein RadA/Sms